MSERTEPRDDAPAESPAERRAERAGSVGPRPPLRVGAVVAVAALAGFLVWMFMIRDDGGSSTATGSSTTIPAGGSAPVAVSQEALEAFAATAGHAVYWAGPDPGMTYELSVGPRASVFVRYLPEGVEAGVRDPYLTIGSYPVPNAFEVTETQSTRSDAVRLRTDDGSVAFYQSPSPTNVYLAFPGTRVQIEVYDPSAERAQELVSSGSIRPVS